MNRVRIELIREGKVVKTFDRLAENRNDAEDLARQINSDSGIKADDFRCTFERRCRVFLTLEGKSVEMLETKGLDEEDAVKQADEWARKTGKTFDRAKVRFID